MSEELSPLEREKLFNKWLIAEYLRYGSVDEVYKAHDYDLPISYAGFQRLLDKWGIVKAAGPNTRLTEALVFLEMLSQERIPLERLYRDMPPSFKTSMGTLHRIFSYIRKETIRRVGTALVITSSDNNLILIGNDISPIVRTDVGKPFGSLTVPMGYSRRGEGRATSILRVLQQEVFTLQAIEKEKFVKNLIPQEPRPFMYLDIADVRVSVYRLSLPDVLADTKNFTSYKIANHRYAGIAEILGENSKLNFRAGIKEIAQGFKRYLESQEEEPFYSTANLNRKLALLPLEL